MALTDAEIRWAMVKSVESVISKIRSHELPVLTEGTQVFATNGDFGERENGDSRYWLAALIVTPRIDLIEQIKAILHQS